MLSVPSQFAECLSYRCLPIRAWLLALRPIIHWLAKNAGSVPPHSAGSERQIVAVGNFVHSNVNLGLH